MTFRFSGLALALAAILLVQPAHAGAILTLDHGTVWQTVKNGEDSQAFLQIHNTGDEPDTLTSVDCTIADHTELIDAKGESLASLDIGAGQTVIMSATGIHLMLHNVRYPVAKDGILPCAFSFAQAGRLIGYLNAMPAPRS